MQKELEDIVDKHGVSMYSIAKETALPYSTVQGIVRNKNGASAATAMVLQKWLNEWHKKQS